MPERGRDAVGAEMVIFRVRRCTFSLKYRAIRPSAVFGTRRKAAVRRETYAWAPDFTLYLSVL